MPFSYLKDWPLVEVAEALTPRPRHSLYPEGQADAWFIQSVFQLTSRSPAHAISTCGQIPWHVPCHACRAAPISVAKHVGSQRTGHATGTCTVSIAATSTMATHGAKTTKHKGMRMCADTAVVEPEPKNRGPPPGLVAQPLETSEVRSCGSSHHGLEASGLACGPFRVGEGNGNGTRLFCKWCSVQSTECQ